MPRTLLLADDSVTIQKVVGLSFASEDIVLVTVSNGDDALTRAREIRPDLVLADIVMPGRNGYEVCEAIKSDPALSHVPVLLLTGTFEAFDQERARRAGADGHVTKPFEAQALVQQVMELMARPRSAPIETPPEAFEIFEAPDATTDPLLGDDFAAAAEIAIDSEAAEGEFELATVAEEESAADALAAEAGVAADALAAPVDRFDSAQESFRGTPLFAPENVAGDFGFDRPPLPAEPQPTFPTPVSQADTDALSPRAAAPAPAPLLPEADDFDLGFEDEPFEADEPSLASTPLAEAPRVEGDDLGTDTLLDPGACEPDELSFDDFDDPLASTRGGSPSASDRATEADLIEAFDVEPSASPGSTATVIASATPSAAAPAAAPGFDLSPVLRERLHDTLEKIAWEAFSDLSDTIVRQALERIEAIAWEVIPQLAEQLVREEIRRMKGE